MTTATSSTVTLDREAIPDLLIEVYGVVGAIERLAGASPTALTAEIGTKAERVAAAVLGDLPDDDEDTGPRVELWDAGARRADELLGRKALADAPPVIRQLAAALEGGESDG